MSLKYVPIKQRYPGKPTTYHACSSGGGQKWKCTASGLVRNIGPSNYNCQGLRSLMRSRQKSNHQSSSSESIHICRLQGEEVLSQATAFWRQSQNRNLLAFREKRGCICSSLKWKIWGEVWIFKYFSRRGSCDCLQPIATQHLINKLFSVSGGLVSHGGPISRENVFYSTLWYWGSNLGQLDSFFVQKTEK